MAKPHSVYYMDVIYSRYTEDGVTPIDCRFRCVATHDGTKQSAYKAAIEHLKESGMVKEGWRLTVVDYPDMVSERYLKLKAKCKRNADKIFLQGRN